MVPLKMYINASLTFIENHVSESSEQLKSPFYSVSRDSPPAAAKEKGITGDTPDPGRAASPPAPLILY